MVFLQVLFGVFADDRFDFVIFSCAGNGCVIRQDPRERKPMDPVQPIAPTTVVAPPAAAPPSQQSVPSQAPVAAPPAPQAAPAFDPSLVKGIGINPAEYTNVNDLVAAIAEQNRQQQAVIRYSQQAQIRQPEPTPAAPPSSEWDVNKYFASKWNTPAWDDQWATMIETGAVIKDESGTFVPSPGHEWISHSPSLAALNQYEIQRTSQVRSLFNGNPIKKIWDDIQEPLAREVDRIVQERLQSSEQDRESRHAVKSWLDEHHDKIVAREVTDPITGRQTTEFTEWGQRVQNCINRLAARGITDHAEQIATVMEFMPPPQAAPAPTLPPPEPPKPPTTWLHDAYARAGGNGDGNGRPVHVPNGASRPNLETFFIDRMKALSAV